MTKKDKIIRGMLFCYTIFYIENFFLPTPYIKEISCCFLFAILFLSLPDVRRFNRNVCLGFFFCGLLIFLFTGAPVNRILSALGENGGLVAMYVLVPVMSMPFFYEDYQSELGNIARRHTSSVLPFLLFVLFSSYFLAIVVYMGCLIILYHLFIRKAEEYDSLPLFRIALLHGYAASGFLGPSWAAIAIVTSRLHLNWIDILPAGAVFSALMLVGTSIYLYLAVKNDPQRYPRIPPDKNTLIDWRRVRTLSILAAVLVGGIILMSYVTRWSMYIIVPLISFPFAFFTALLQDKTDKFKSGANAYCKVRLLSSKAEFCLFIVAGFLSASIEYSQIGMLAVRFLPESLFQYPLLVALAIVASMVVMAIIGIHAVVSAPSIALALSAEHIGLNQLSFALVLLSGSIIGAIVSPFSAGTMIMAGFFQKSSWQTGPVENWKFAAFMVLVFSFAVGLLYRLTA